MDLPDHMDTIRVPVCAELRSFTASRDVDLNQTLDVQTYHRHLFQCAGVMYSVFSQRKDASLAMLDFLEGYSRKSAPGIAR